MVSDGDDGAKSDAAPLAKTVIGESSVALTEKPSRRFTRSAVKVVAAGTPPVAAQLGSAAKTLVLGGDDDNMLEATVEDPAGSVVIVSALLARDNGGSNCGHAEIGSPVCGDNASNFEYSRKRRGERLLKSALKAPCMDQMNSDAEGSDVENGIVEKPQGSLPENRSRRFTRSVLKTPKDEQGTSAEDRAACNEEICEPDKSVKRFTRSSIKSVGADPAVADTSETFGSEGKKSRNGPDDGSLSMAPQKKMEIKMSKKIVLTKLPANVRDLLATGFLEGFPVKYSCNNKQIELEGVIRGNGILCYCASCKGSRAVSAYNFELHAGSTKKHPSDFIFLESGKSLHDVLRVCMNSPLDMLEASIQNAIGTLPPSRSSICEKCRKPLNTSHSGKFTLLCDSCLDAKHHQATPNASNGSSSHAVKLSKAVLMSDSFDGASKSQSSHQKKSGLGRLTKKDLGLHKLVFRNDILPDGTVVAYYNSGKKLLDGYKQDLGIFCSCCNAVVSPSQFEAHAGRASRRKPYNNIYTSNGVSLHELAVSLSKDRKLSSFENDDLCNICRDGGDLLCCDLCPRSFHKECAGISVVPKGDWHCQNCQNMHQREKCVEYNTNAIAAGRVSGVDSIEQIFKRCIRIVTRSEVDIGGCVLCREHDFCKVFSERTVILCDQCEKEYHVGCLKEHNMDDLKELPAGEWFCCDDCRNIHDALEKLRHRGSEPLQDLDADTIMKKCNNDTAVDIRWRLLSGKDSDGNRSLLREAVSIFRDTFDPIIDARTGRDLIPVMVNGESAMDQDFRGMHCAVLTVNSTVVSAGILRIFGREVAELPLVATRVESQGKGYFQALFSCIERLLASFNVKHFVLPAADEALAIWTEKFGFAKIASDELQQYTKDVRTMIFYGTSMLHKPVPTVEVPLQGIQ